MSGGAVISIPYFIVNNEALRLKYAYFPPIEVGARYPSVTPDGWAASSIFVRLSGACVLYLYQMSRHIKAALPTRRKGASGKKRATRGGGQDEQHPGG
jgi:hypothetical protein